MRTIILGVMILSFVQCGLVYAQTEQLNKTAYVDTHVHFNAKSMRGGQQQDSESGNGPRQGSMGRPGARMGDGPRAPRRSQTQSDIAAGYDTAAEQLIAEMDKYGIQKALIMPPPQISEQGAVCSYKDLIGVVGKHPGRLYFLGGGDTLRAYP